MKKLSIMAALAVVTGLALTLMGGVSASAHHGDITVAATCEASGEYALTHTLTWSNVPEGVTGEVQYRYGTEGWLGAPAIATPSGSMVFPKMIPGDSAVGPWIEVTVAWSNGYQGATHHMTRAEGLAGDCVEDIPPVIPEKPEGKPYQDSGTVFFCEDIHFWSEYGFYGSTLIDGVWVYNEEPTIVEREITQRKTTQAERIENGCEDAPVLASTGVEAEWWQIILGTVLLMVGIGAVIVADKRKGNQ